jgi:hypothetical protein
MLRATSTNDDRRAGGDGGGDEGEDREARGAGDEGGEKHRQEPGLSRLDDADAQDRRDIAAEPDAHGDETLAVESHEVHEPVHDEGGPSHVPHVLEECQGGEEDQEDREEGQDRADASDHPFDDQALYPGRCRRQERFDHPAESADAILQELLEGKADLVRQEEHEA